MVIVGVVVGGRAVVVGTVVGGLGVVVGGLAVVVAAPGRPILTI